MRTSFQSDNSDDVPLTRYVKCGLRMPRGYRDRFPGHRPQRTPLVSDPGMHHGTCVTHVPWCMSGSLTCGGGENFPAFPAHAQPAILRIWPETHGLDWGYWFLPSPYCSSFIFVYHWKLCNSWSPIEYHVCIWSVGLPRLPVSTPAKYGRDLNNMAYDIFNMTNELRNGF